MIRALILSIAVFPLAACGFSPVYGTGPARANAGPVTILEIEGRTGSIKGLVLKTAFVKKA